MENSRPNWIRKPGPDDALKKKKKAPFGRLFLLVG